MADAITSLRGRRWQVRPAAETCAAMGDSFLDDILGRRGLTTETARRWLDARIADEMPDPSRFMDMDAAIDRVAAAVKAGEKIAVFGDYDVDGATSSSLLVRYFRLLGIETLYHIPDRMKEGYGPNIGALRALKAAGASVVVVVDSGSTAFDPLAAAAADGLDVVVLDHHATEAELPPARALVNPNRQDEDRSFYYLCAAGLAFLFLVGLQRSLRQSGWFAQREEPRLMELLDLVALGTVADVVPLVGLNRAYVRRGLIELASRRNIGLNALLDVSKAKAPYDGFSLGFLLGPRVNAGGRVGDAMLGTQLLTCLDPEIAADYAGRLDILNAERREIEADCIEQATARLESLDRLPGVIVLADEAWHPGIVGIAAARIREKFERPVLIGGMVGDYVKGSGRSMMGYDLGAAVIGARKAGLLKAGGGHPAAAGFTCHRDGLAAFQAHLEGCLPAEGLPEEVHRVDTVVALAGVTIEQVDGIQRLGPFGNGNPEPKVLLTGGRLLSTGIVKDVHLRLEVSAGAGPRLKAMAFRQAGTPFAEALGRLAGKDVDLIGRLKINDWQGRQSVEMMLEDAVPAA